MSTGDDEDQRAVIARMAATIEAMNSALVAMAAAQAAQAAEAARAEEARAAAEMARVSVATRSTKTLAELFALYHASWSGESWARQVSGTMAAALRSLGPKVADELTRADWHHWRDNVRAKEITVRKKPPTTYTLNYEIKRWRSAYRWGKNEGHVLTNPLLEVTPKRGAKKHRHTRPTQEEVVRILVACSPRQRAFVILAARTGMRASEVRTMRWPNVDLDLGRAKIEWQIAKARQERIVPLTSDCILALKALKTDILPLHIFESSRFRGHPLSASALWMEFRHTVDGLGIAAAAGDGRVVFHDLRHTFASWAAEQLPLPVVAAIGGWTDLRTMGRYIQVTDGQLSAARGQLERAVRRKPKRASDREPEVNTGTSLLNE